MGKGRKILDGALKLLRPSQDADAVDLADTTPLGYYQAVKAGKKAVKYTRATSSKPGEYFLYETIPFAEGSDASPTLAKIPVSKRAIEGIGGTGLTTAILNIVVVGDDSTAVEIQGYRPATATVKVSQDGSVSTTSKLTNRTYQKKNGASYTFPFGLGTAGGDTDLPEGLKGRKAAIIIAVEAGAASKSVSFKPEIY